MMYSIKLLSDELEVLKTSLKKSIDSYKRCSISLERYHVHLNNLLPKIKELEASIKKLTK